MLVNVQPGVAATAVTAQVIIHFQRYPGTDAASGIAGLEYTLFVDGVEQLPAVHTTDATGKVTLNINPASTNFLHILGTRYRLIFITPLPAGNAVQGIKRRLNMLGYAHAMVETSALQPDPANPGGAQILVTTPTPIDTDDDHAILCFQADNNLLIDSLAGSNTQGRLRSKAGQ